MKTVPMMGEGPGVFWVLILSSSLHLSFSLSLLDFWDSNNSFKVFAPEHRYLRVFAPISPIYQPSSQTKTHLLKEEHKEPAIISVFEFESPNVNSRQKVFSEKQQKKMEADSLNGDAASDIEVTYRSNQELTFTLRKSLKLTLEMWVPLGTQVKWVKRNVHRFNQREKVVLDEFHHAVGRFMEMLLENFPRLHLSQFKMKLHTLFFIECPEEKDQGQYSVEVKTPGGEMMEFDFFLSGIPQDNRLKSNDDEAANCSGNLYPRIIDFAKEIRGKKGLELFLPCRHSHREVGMTVDWTQRERVLTEANYAVTENSELQIFNLTKSDEGWYKCTLKYNKEDGVDVYDSQITYVRVLD